MWWAALAAFLSAARLVRNIDGTSSSIANDAYEHHYAAYFQDRWKPSQRVSVKAGVRVENNRIYTQDREKVLGALGMGGESP